MNVLMLQVAETTATARVVESDAEVKPGAATCVEVAVNATTMLATEVSVAGIWAAVTLAARRAVRRSGVAGIPDREITGLILTAFEPSLVLLGADDQPLGPPWLPTDARSRSAARQVRAHVGAEFEAAFGHPASPGSVSALHWRRWLTDDPYLSHRARGYYHGASWLGLQLTGERAFAAGDAALSGLCPRGATAWSSRWCDYFEVDRAWLPPIVPAGAIIGSLRAASAAALGVPAGIPVAVGA